MKSPQKHASRFAQVLALVALLLVAVPRTKAQQDGPPSSGRPENTFNPPPFDFSDDFYGANGIDVTQLDQAGAGRFGLFRQFGPPSRKPNQPNWVVDNSNTDPTRNNIRILATTGGYPDDGSGTATEFISIIAFVLNQNFFNAANQSGGTGNARGIAMQDIVGNFEGYAALKQRLAGGVLAPTPCGTMGDSTLPAGTPCFPVTSVATPQIRQDWRFATNRNAIDGSDGNDPLGIVSGSPNDSPFGYFCDDLLGMWILTYFWFNENSVGDPAGHIHPTAQCTSMLSQLASMHGRGLDGTPNVLTADELNFLEGSDVGAEPLGPNFPNPPSPGCMAEGQLDTGGADGGAVWLVCPAIQDPRAGAIRKDAFLDSVLRADGTPVDGRFNQNFSCLQNFGDFCNVSIALQNNGINPNPTRVGTDTNVTVLYQNTASTNVNGVTLTQNIVDASGRVVATKSQTGLTMGPGQTNNITIVWRPTATGTYTVQGTASNSAGTVFGQNNIVALVTVN